MELKHFYPLEQLKPLIKKYWLLEVAAPNDLTAIHSFFPLDAVEIIFHLKSSFSRLNNNGWNPEPAAFIEGHQSGTINVKQQGLLKTIGISLYPWAAAYFFNSSAAIFTNSLFTVEEADKELSNLHDELAMCGDDNLIAAICNKYFLKRLQQSRFALNASDRMLIEVMDEKRPGYIAGEVRNKWAFSKRYFEKKCLELLGVSAGDLLKKRRMKKALTLTTFQQFISYTDVAHATGYYDQAHFIKNFRHYFGNTPTEFFKNDNIFLTTFL